MPNEIRLSATLSRRVSGGLFCFRLGFCVIQASFLLGIRLEFNNCFSYYDFQNPIPAQSVRWFRKRQSVQALGVFAF
jgi:hypothetical protein